jgi:predicted metalloprotease
LFEALAAVQVFSVVRNWNLTLLRTVPPQARSKRVRHPERGDMSFQTIVETMAGHDLNHLRQLQAVADAAV